MVVGSGGAGKTSLVASLLGQTLMQDLPTTRGVQLSAIDLDRHVGGRPVVLHMWDTPGQAVARFLINWLLTDNAIFIFVVGARQGISTWDDELETWLSWISTRLPRSPTIIAFTHSDQAHVDLDFDRIRERFPSLVGAISVSNETGAGIEVLKAAIGNEVAKMPWATRDADGCWQETIDALEETGRSYLFRREFRAFCWQNGLGEGDASRLAKYLERSGRGIYFGESSGFPDLTVIDPEWVANAVAAVLESEDIGRQGGVLLRSQVPKLVSRVSPDHPAETEDDLLRILECLDIAFRVPGGDSYLVGEQVPQVPPRLPWQAKTPLTAGTFGLTCCFSMDDPPTGLMSFLIVRTHENSVGLHWQQGVFLRHGLTDTEALIEALGRRRFRLTVRGASPIYLFRELMDLVESTLGRYWQHLRYVIQVPCGTNNCPGCFQLPALLALGERGALSVSCDTCYREQVVASLLTGFRHPASQIQVAASNSEYISIVLDYVKSLLKIIRHEVPDCPRLFQLSPASGRANWILFWRKSYEVVLWCEHRGEEHPWEEAAYRFSCPKKFLLKLAPYLAVVLKALRLAVGAAAPISEILINDNDAGKVKSQLELMKVLVDGLGVSVDSMSVQERNTLSLQEGAALRAFRSLLHSLDTTRFFGGLERVVTPAGDLLWVCPLHQRHYEPQ